MQNYKTNEIIKVALYIRVSTEEQAKHGYSLDSQEKRLKEYSKIHNYKVIDIYKDEGKSARSKLKQRTELLRLIEDVKKKKIDRIIFWRLDRWFRNIADYYKVQEILNSNDVDWECSDEEYNTTTSNGRLHLNIKLSIAQNESDQTSDRIKFNFENMIKSKKAICCSHSCSLGYKVEGERGNRKVVKDKDKEEIVNFIFDTYELINNYRRTAILVKEKFNYEIDPLIIKRMLTKTIYYGEYKGVSDYCESYISKERFNALQSIKSRQTKQNTNHTYIFSGLLRCKTCGTRMSGGTHRELKRYRCKKYKDRLACSNGKQVQEKKLEKLLLTNLLYLQKKELSMSGKIKEKNINIDIDKEISKINNKISRLNDLYIEGTIKKEKYDFDYAKFKKEIENLQSSKIIKKEKQIIHLPQNFSELYNKLNEISKRAFWCEYIEYVEFDPIPKEFEDRIKIILK